MSGEATTVLQQALTLAPDERYEVAQQILDSLGELPEEQEFYDEIARRSDEAHEHPERLLDGRKVMEELREHFRRKVVP